MHHQFDILLCILINWFLVKLVNNWSLMCNLKGFTYSNDKNKNPKIKDNTFIILQTKLIITCIHKTNLQKE